ncbi:hypothetical protein KPH14_002852 [Odynerus spinipes]|uniref:RING-type domain-containing protein n=1 Tax=Odynerus spinipes TaxID=1348599 RepID=A0AAD9RWC7_9HYME|nr:hypothetical protein KPH14_002852 [Odynerus spinipes]
MSTERNQDTDEQRDSIYTKIKDDENKPDYRFEAVRLQSFKNWPVVFLKPTVLASAGFYYMNKSDIVQCFECHVVVHQWEQGDIPMMDHLRVSPRCRFVRGIPCGNVPIGVDPATVPPPSPPGLDTCGVYDMQYEPTSILDLNALFSSQLQLSNISKLTSFGFERPKPPAYSPYITYEARLRTFDTWSKSIPPTKEQLADAGFFYIGNDDRTICYHCGGGLENWKTEDDPWQQHAKWFPKCYYLLMVKGQEYVNAVSEQVASSLKEESSSSLKYTNIEDNSWPSNVSEDSGMGSRRSSIDSDKGTVHDLCNIKAHESIDDARLCKICYNAERSIVFLPCGHMVACGKCASDMTKCAICRQPILLTVRVILS